MDRELLERTVGNAILRLVSADLTERDVDAIVNAANSRLRHGGGVAGAIVRKGGQVIQEESDAIGHVPVGGAAMTSAGKLKARYVIHAVGPMMGEGDEDNKLKRAITSVLELASEKGLHSISMPAVSAGIFGFPKDRCAKILVGETAAFLTRTAGTSLARKFSIRVRPRARPNSMPSRWEMLLSPGIRTLPRSPAAGRTTAQSAFSAVISAPFSIPTPILMRRLLNEHAKCKCLSFRA
jgi:O-acetyl-ADP-ribose deacetylase (regulator of RNase III)